MKRKMLCIILISIITTLFCGVSFASREGELKEGIGQKENEIEQIKKEKDEALQEIQDLTAKISQYEDDIKELKYKINRLEISIKDKIIDKLSPFFTVSVLWDTNDLLEYKDSPTDRGKETLLQLMDNKIYVGTNQ